MQARPDWALSANTERWNAELARRTGPRIAAPDAFSRALASPRGEERA